MTNENYEIIDLIVEAEDAGERLDQFIFQKTSIESRSLATKLIRSDLVSVEGGERKLKSSTKIEVGEKIEVKLPIATNLELKPYDFPLDIMFEDEHLIMVNKPSGLVVHPSAGHRDDTLVNALIHRGQNFHIGLEDVRPGIVHRLDKDTSGVMVVAKTNEALEKMTTIFKERNLNRIYWALCVGDPKFEYLKMESEIGRHPSDRKKMSAHSKHGKSAITEAWKIGSYHSKLSLFKFKLGTGRTHQIRVHCAENHFPVLGDFTYSKPGILKNNFSPKQVSDVKNLGRFCLHAALLSFDHPITGENLSAYADIPDELQSILSDYDLASSITEEMIRAKT